MGLLSVPWYSKRNYILKLTEQMGRYQSGQKWLVHTNLFINKQEKGDLNVHAFTNNKFPIILKQENATNLKNVSPFCCIERM